ncbi:MAG: carbon starvation CstA family protein [Candidatus Zixiibacteriota bacterium]
MNVLIYVMAALVAFVLAYRIYGRFISRAVGEDRTRITPAVELNDGTDYFPTRPAVLFAHHYSTIAGAGPIVGPVMGILYGVGPAWLWVVIGAIMIGGVHDLVALYASVRERGCSMAEIARKTLGQTGFLLFIGFTTILIVLVTSAFLALTAVSLTSLLPLNNLGLDSAQTLLRTRDINGVPHGIIGGIASTSLIVVTLFAPLMGYVVIKRGLRTLPAYLLAAALGAVSIYVGFQIPVALDPRLWMVIIAVYTLMACQVPVWWILQPRDFVNVQILYAGMAAMAVGLIVGGFQGAHLTYPVSNMAAGAQAMGPIWPFLFITIACGAISGFHSLVAGGTSSKQLQSEGQARIIGYGGMLLEGMLAVLVLVTVGSSLSYTEYMHIVWPEVGQGNPILGFAYSMGHLLNSTFGLQVALGSVLGILVVEGFLITTLDTAVRLNRYLLEELWKTVFARPPKIILERWFNSGVSVLLMVLVAWGEGWKSIWPLFGSANQLLAALTLIAVTVWLHRAGRKSWFTVVPAGIMIATTIAALGYKLFTDYLPNGSLLLASTDILLLILSVGVLLLSLRQFSPVRGAPEISPSA